jgi:hypothetical protein
MRTKGTFNHMASSSTLAPGACNLVRDQEWYARRTQKAMQGGREEHAVGLSAGPMSS